MKKYIILLFTLLACSYVQAQNTDAKLKFQEAEKAFEAGNYQSCISLLDETEKLLGQNNSNTLYLRTKAEFKIWETKPYESFEQLDKLKSLCSEYLQKYDTAGLSDIHEISKKLPEVSNQEELEQFGNQFHKENSAQKKQQAIIDHNLVFVEGSTFWMGHKKTAREVTVDNFYIAKFETTVGEWNKYLEATGKTGDKNRELAHYTELLQQLDKTKDMLLGVASMATAGVNVSKLASSGSSQVKQYPTQDSSVFWRITLATGLYKEKGAAYFNDVLYPEILGYCRWLQQKYGGTWRLPTEAEWEYVVRNGNTPEHIPATIKGGDFKNYKKHLEYYRLSDKLVFTYKNEMPTGRSKPNALGIYDLINNHWENVYELCSDYYSKSGTALRVVKGGDPTNNNRPSEWRAAFHLGFRVVYIPDQQ
ncbi:MAG: SUMF1/EgtB/PvdO family nonheme iron enzyme [Flavobacteriaceae bacterium]